MEQVLELVKQANGFLWDFLLIVLLCGTGIYYTIRLNFIQVRKLGEGFRLVFGNMSLNGKKSGKSGEMTPFQSVATAIAAQVGTGNLAGAATALIGCASGTGRVYTGWQLCALHGTGVWGGECPARHRAFAGGQAGQHLPV